MLTNILTRRWTGAVVIALAVGVLGLSACKDKIGDSCDFNVDCSSKGDRLCDLSSPGGYCTIENCNDKSCPKEAVCIAFYPVAFLNHPCDPGLEDLPDCVDSGEPEGCNPYTDLDPEAAWYVGAPEAAWYNQCTADERCIQSGFCSSKSSARRWCMKKCEKGKDCRDDYECRSTGVEGAEKVLPLDEEVADQTAHFCAPKR